MTCEICQLPEDSHPAAVAPEQEVVLRSPARLLTDRSKKPVHGLPVGLCDNDGSLDARSEVLPPGVSVERHEGAGAPGCYPLVDVAEFLLLRRDLTTQDQNRQEVAA